MAVDAVLALLIGLAGVGGRGEGPGLVSLLVIGYSLPLAWRRIAPRATFVVVCAFGVLPFLAHTRPAPAAVAVLVALYTVSTRCVWRDVAAAAAAVALGAAIASVRWSGRPLESFIMLCALASAAVMSGASIRSRRAYLHELEARAAQLERDRDQQATIAVAAERSRIARELHDIVAHNVSVIVAQADGARYALDANPAQARDALEVIARTGRDALAEMRHIVGVLRPSDYTGDIEPQPSADRIGELVDRLARAGFSVRLTVNGSPRAAAPGPGLAAYRIVQESLTNVFKHAGHDAHAEVTLDYTANGVTIRVDNDRGSTTSRVPNIEAAAEPAPNTVGHGLVGMRERVAMYGGTFTSGTRDDGGYSVSAHLGLGDEQ